ncbi:MAG: hypothetical protein A2Y88_06205 [Chloroflexi bacterium RBG_13_48_10]|nr:MAG: hypothetical protein A2Y88_06205 [Chloroflexi bacterium RBG_13_48_10]
MQTETIHEVTNFILAAKKASYVGGGNTLLPYRLGSHDLQFFKDDWAYHDSYLGESDFIGEEIVYHHGKVVWGMNYFGRILCPEKITSAQAGAFIQQSLSKMYQTGRFLGGFTQTVGEFKYTDENEGDPLYFTGKEWIDLNGEIVYQLVYHGGLITDR